MAQQVYHVAKNHRHASDNNPGTGEKPFLTINKAAALAMPGDTILVREGVYRERVNPARGGEAGRPIVYRAAEGEDVYVRGSEEFRPVWEKVKDGENVYKAPLDPVLFGINAYHGFLDAEVYKGNPYHLNFNREVVARPTDKEEMPTTLGQIFVDGKPLTEVNTYREVCENAFTWIVGAQGDCVYVNLPCGKKTIEDFLIELSVRHTIFAPLKRGLSHIHVIGFVFEHGTNHFPTWGKGAWAQVGLVSCRSGSHWRIEGNVVRYAKGVGIDCGSEGGRENMEFPGEDGNFNAKLHARIEKGETGSFDDLPGHHVIVNNHIVNNGHCGLTGLGHVGTQVIGNVIEKNNRTGYTSPWWEFGGIKFHFFYNGLIKNNLIRDNDAHGIWLDNNFRGSRVTGNVIVNNLWSGVNVELGRGPVLIDNNVIAYTRQGSGVYGHDASDVTIAHNLIYANYNFGVWFAYCTSRVKNEDGCWDIKTFNNMILGNRGGAIAYPMPWECAGNNTSDNNLLMGSGEYLDEGSGPFPPLSQFTNKTHCGQFQEWCGAKVPMTKENTLALFEKLCAENGVAADEMPNLKQWSDHYWVTWDIWKKILKNDVNSRQCSTIKDGLQTRALSFSFKFDDTLDKIACKPVPGVTHDFFDNPIPQDRAKPGPFQHVKTGQNTIVLWPARYAETKWMLD